MQHPSHYNPNQPRVPRGRHEGGRWTDTDFGHGDRVVRLALNDETGAYLQSLRRPRVQIDPARGRPFVAPPALLMRLLGAVAAPFSLLSLQNDDWRQAALILKPQRYHRSRLFGFEALRFLERNEVDELCGEKFREFQDLVDQVYKEIKEKEPDLSPRELGKKVHNEVARRINSKGDPNFAAELTFFLIKNNISPNGPSSGSKAESYGETFERAIKGSKRFDARLKVPEKRLVCVPEIKTGDQGIKDSYIQEIVKRIGQNEAYKDFDDLIIVEVRPRPTQLGVPGSPPADR